MDDLSKDILIIITFIFFLGNIIGGLFYFYFSNINLEEAPHNKIILVIGIILFIIIEIFIIELAKENPDINFIPFLVGNILNIIISLVFSILIYLMYMGWKFAAIKTYNYLPQISKLAWINISMWVVGIAGALIIKYLIYKIFVKGGKQ